MEVAILATNGNSLKRIAWIDTKKDGYYVGMAETFSNGAHTSYHIDGSYWHRDFDGRATRIGMRTPIPEIKGYEHILIYEGPTDSLMEPFFKDFPLRQIDQGVYIDTRCLDKYWRFGVGMLKPYAFQDLDSFVKQAFPSIHLITSVSPWLVVGYGPSRGPIGMEKQSLA